MARTTSLSPQGRGGVLRRAGRTKPWRRRDPARQQARPARFPPGRLTRPGSSRADPRPMAEQIDDASQNGTMSARLGSRCSPTMGRWMTDVRAACWTRGPTAGPSPERYQTRQCPACSERHLPTSATIATRERCRNRRPARKGCMALRRPRDRWGHPPTRAARRDEQFGR